MPLYDYQCTECDNKFSELRKISEKDDEIACPNCNSLKNEKQLTTFAYNSSIKSAGCPTAPSCPSASQYG